MLGSEEDSSLGLADFVPLTGFVFEVPTDRFRFPPKPWFSPPIILGERPKTTRADCTSTVIACNS